MLCPLILIIQSLLNAHEGFLLVFQNLSFYSSNSLYIFK